MGNASIVGMKDRKLLSRNQYRTDIFAVEGDLYSQGVTQTEQKLFKSQVTRHKGESLHVEPDDFRLSTALAMRDYVPSFFSHSLCTGRLMLLVNGSTVYLRDTNTSEWIECIAFDSLIVNLY